MRLRDFRIGWRLLRQQPAFSAIAILGLALGFAVCFLLLGYVRYCYSYDDHVPERERIYVVKHRLNFIPQPQWLEYTPFALREVALRSGLPLEASAWWPRKATLRQDGREQEAELTVVDPAFERMFGLRAKAGDLHAALTRPDGLALTEQTALRLFGRTDVLERTVQLDRQLLRVRAILPDPPSNTSLPYTALVGMGTALWPAAERDAALANWMGINGKIYLKAGPGLTEQALAAALQDATDHAPWQSAIPPEQRVGLGGRKLVDIGLGSLKDAYFDTSVANTIGAGQRGDRRVVLGLGAVGLLILALAVFNYVSLAAVRTLRRQREIAMRRVLGASAPQLLAQFMAEALLVALCATVLGMLLAWLLLPSFAALVERQLDGLYTPAAVALFLLLGAAVGLLAGAYPGWLARGVDMRQALSRRSGETPGGARLRRTLAVLQLAAAMGLGSIALSIAWQTRYASQAPAGFDPAPLLVLELPRQADDAANSAFREAAARVPGVLGAALSRTVPGRDEDGGTRASQTVQGADGRAVPMSIRQVGAEFFGVYGVRALAGRMLDARIERDASASGIVVNMAAVRALGIASPQQALGTWLNGRELQIVGVAPELRWQTLRDPVRPTMYRIGSGDRTLTLRMADTRDTAALAAIDAAWQRHFPGQPLAVQHASSYLAQGYAEDVRLARLLAWSSGAVFALAACGVYVLAAQAVQRRAREIVMRKLHGAGRRAIALLLGREFLWLTAVAAVLGLAPATVAVQRYLAGFADRAPQGWWPVAASLLAAIALVALAAARHTLSALRIAPATALRD